MKEITELNELIWKPEIEVVRFANVDVVTMSNVLEEDELPPWVIQ